MTYRFEFAGYLPELENGGYPPKPLPMYFLRHYTELSFRNYADAMNWRQANYEGPINNIHALFRLVATGEDVGLFEKCKTVLKQTKEDSEC